MLKKKDLAIFTSPLVETASSLSRCPRSDSWLYGGWSIVRVGTLWPHLELPGSSAEGGMFFLGTCLLKNCLLFFYLVQFY